MKKYPDIYRKTVTEARNGGNTELDKYRTSLKENIACAKAIDEAIRNNFDGMYLNDGVEIPVIEKYGIDRVVYVLANTLQQKDYDERFSIANIEWAEKIFVAADIRNDEFCSNAHPAILDGFCNIIRKAVKEREKPSVKKQLAEFPKQPEPKQKNIDKGAR